MVYVVRVLNGVECTVFNRQTMSQLDGNGKTVEICIFVLHLLLYTLELHENPG